MQTAPGLPRYIKGDYRLQQAWVVQDLRLSVRNLSTKLGIGPWFLQERFTPRNARCDGVPTDIVLSVAFAFRGDTMLELVQQHTGHASTFTRRAPSEDRLHHIGVATSRFDSTRNRYAAEGYTAVFSAEPAGRLVMMHSPTSPVVVEILEWTSQRYALFEGIRRAAIDWDGSGRVRTFTSAPH